MFEKYVLKIIIILLYRNGRRRRRRRCYNILLVGDGTGRRSRAPRRVTMKYLAGCGGAVSVRGGEPGHARAVLYSAHFTRARVHDSLGVCVRARRRSRIAALVCACVWLCAAVLRAHFERTCSAAGEDTA